MFRNIRCKPFPPFSVYNIYIYHFFPPVTSIYSRQRPRVDFSRTVNRYGPTTTTVDTRPIRIWTPVIRSTAAKAFENYNYCPIKMHVWLSNSRVLPRSTPDGHGKIRIKYNMYLGNKNISVCYYAMPAVDFIAWPVLEARVQVKISPNVISNCPRKFVNAVVDIFKCILSS